MWVGPQAEWYNRQTLVPNKKGAVWPPDPFLEYGRFTVTEQSDRRAVLQGPESPISGIAFAKTIEIAPNGEVRLTTAARNVRQEPLSWDLWSNTRVSPLLRLYVPIRGKIRIEMESGNDLDNQPFAYSLENGFFIVDNQRQTVAAPFKRRIGKAFLEVRCGYLAAFSASLCLIKRFPLVPAAQLHRDHANVEIYYALEAGKEAEGLMELENHGPYLEIAPGGTIAMQETFMLLDYKGEDTIAGQIAFLKSLGLET
ncbi:MAG: DUF4380 domain-containing protein, partial [Planctomycetota bacterium]|nr:DUF4380 domain-containing protein [Planctomycetota bacterium]